MPGICRFMFCRFCNSLCKGRGWKNSFIVSSHIAGFDQDGLGIRLASIFLWLVDLSQRWKHGIYGAVSHGCYVWTNPLKPHCSVSTPSGHQHETSELIQEVTSKNAKHCSNPCQCVIRIDKVRNTSDRNSERRL